MFNKAITIFQEIDGDFTKVTVDGVFFAATKGISLENKGESEANSIKVVIPLENMPANFIPREGSYFCMGKIDSDYENSTMLIQSEPAYLLISCDKMDYGDKPVFLLIGR